MEGSELFRDAEKWLINNPGKTLRDYRKETGYDGPALKTRQKKGQTIRISYKGKSSDAQTRRVRLETPKTSEEAKYVRLMQNEARQRSKDTLHQYIYSGRPSVAEHNLSLASGGSNESMSISDPEFAAFKTEIESKLPPGKIAEIDDVTGGIRILDENYNKFEPTSKQPGFTLELGDDINTELNRGRLDINKGSVKFRGARAIPYIGFGVAAYVAGEQAMAGDLVGAGGTLIDEAVGEVGLDSTPVASGELMDAPAQQQAILERQANPTVADKIIQDPLNELEYAGKQVMSFFGGALRMASPLGL